MYASTSPGPGTKVNQSSQSRPSAAAAARPAACPGAIGSRRTPFPSRVTGASWIIDRILVRRRYRRGSGARRAGGFVFVRVVALVEQDLDLPLGLELLLELEEAGAHQPAPLAL